MNEFETQLDYPLGEALPEPGTSLAVAEDVRWVRMPLPFQLNHINLWLLRDAIEGVQGWTIVDCGIDDAATRGAWAAVFRSELQGLPVLRVIVTHMHPDHMGLADWLTRHWSGERRECRLWASATDYSAARMASTSLTSIGGPRTAEFLARHGLSDPGVLDKVRARSNYYATMVPRVPECYRRLMHGMAVSIGGRTWTCRAGYGHAPEHMALHCAELGTLISGDMILPRISTNVSVHEFEPEADPLMLYLDSIQQLRALPAPTLVLPSHGRPFVGLHTRIDQLHAHHAARLKDAVDACSVAPRSAHDLLGVLFKRSFGLHETTFAMGEAIAHLNALWLDGTLSRVVDARGVFRFAAPAPSP